jgi:ketosteroid isomerase-like protein
MNLFLSVAGFPAPRRNTMKRLLAVALLLMWAAPRSGAQAPKGGPEQELIALENSWSQASVKRDGAALPRFYADEYIFTDEDGVVSNKTKEIANITGGVFKLNSFKFENIAVHVYGEVAVVTGKNTIKGTWEDIERDISGPYRFTDVFVRRDGRWQCVASQASRIAGK